MYYFRDLIATYSYCCRRISEGPERHRIERYSLLLFRCCAPLSDHLQDLNLFFMGSASTHGYRPYCPKFSWRNRNCLWTESLGDKEPYAFAVLCWSHYHDVLSLANSKCITRILSSVTLHTQLYSRAIDLCRSIPND